MMQKRNVTVPPGGILDKFKQEYDTMRFGEKQFPDELAIIL